MNSYYRAILAIAVIGAVTFVSGCTKVSVSGKKDGGTGTASDGGAQQPSEVAAAPPPLQGVWTVSFKFGDKDLSAKMELAQNGNQLAGQGTDDNGQPWAIGEGVVEGNRVNFTKQYSPDSPPIVYDGNIKWLNDPQYTGWLMEGTYQKQSPDGKVVSGDFVATPDDPASMPPPTQSSAPGPVDQTSNPPVGSGLMGGGRTHPPDEPVDNSRAPHISGRFDGEYQFKFKRIKMKMWLEQDNDRVTGHGVDVNTNEKFTIARGWYKFPNVTLVRKYTKGTGAALTREFTFKGKVSNSSKGPTIKGETEYGGGWSATIVR
jgi:hypothetical protein